MTSDRFCPSHSITDIITFAVVGTFLYQSISILLATVNSSVAVGQTRVFQFQRNDIFSSQEVKLSFPFRWVLGMFRETFGGCGTGRLSLINADFLSFSNHKPRKNKSRLHLVSTKVKEEKHMRMR